MSSSDTAAIAGALNNIASALQQLGFGNAITEMGAIEGHTVLLSKALKEAGSEVSDAIKEAGDRIATAIYRTASE